MPESNDSRIQSQSRSGSADADDNKRKQEEIEIDLDQPEPLSKKQKRLLKKGRIDETKKDPRKPHDSSQRSKYGVWIGNLSFETTQNELRRFLIAKTCDNEETSRITDESISRINMPMNGRKCKGFAYVDFDTPEHAQACISLSESQLSGRNLLIKDHTSFEGRPPKQSNGVTNPATRILFVGNLSHDTTEEDLEFNFQHCGEITKVRMATFQDSGKCKGFAFIDFKEVESATKALGDKRCKIVNGRILRMEYGEDRSKRTKQQKSHLGAKAAVVEGEVKDDRDNNISETFASHDNFQNDREAVEHSNTWKSRSRKESKAKSPGLALATAQRASSSIIPSTGKKITFD